MRGNFVIGRDASGQAWIKGFVEQIFSEPNALETAHAVVDELRDAQETLSRTGEHLDVSTVSPHTKGVLEKLRSLSTEAKIATIIGIVSLLLQLIALSTDDDASTVYEYTIERQTIEKQVIKREQPRRAERPPNDEMAGYNVIDPLQEGMYSSQVMGLYGMPEGMNWGRIRPGVFKLLLEVYVRLTTLFPGTVLELEVESENDANQFPELWIHCTLPGVVTEYPERLEAPQVQEMFQEHAQELGQRYMLFSQWFDGLDSPAKEQLRLKVRAALLRPI